MICHSVANHGEFPHGVRLNKLYVTDGTDSLPATEDEILLYGDDSHKAKKKPTEAVKEPRSVTAPVRVESYAEIAKKTARKSRAEAAKKAVDKGIDIDDETQEMIELGRRMKAKLIAEEIMRGGASRREGSGASKGELEGPEFCPPVLVPETSSKKRVPKISVATVSVPSSRRTTAIKTSKKEAIPTTVAAHDLEVEPDSEKEGDDNDTQSLRLSGAGGVHIGLSFDVVDISVPPSTGCSVQNSTADVAATVQMKAALSEVATKPGVILPVVTQAAAVIVNKAQTALSALREAIDCAASTRKLDEDDLALVRSVVSPTSSVVASVPDVPSTSSVASASSAIPSTREEPTRTLAELAAAFYATAAGGKEPPKKPKRVLVGSTSSVAVPVASASGTPTTGAPKNLKVKVAECESGSEA